MSNSDFGASGSPGSSLTSGSSDSAGSGTSNSDLGAVVSTGSTTGSGSWGSGTSKRDEGFVVSTGSSATGLKPVRRRGTWLSVPVGLVPARRGQVRRRARSSRALRAEIPVRRARAHRTRSRSERSPPTLLPAQSREWGRQRASWQLPLPTLRLLGAMCQRLGVTSRRLGVTCQRLGVTSRRLGVTCQRLGVTSQRGV